MNGLIGASMGRIILAGAVIKTCSVTKDDGLGEQNPFETPLASSTKLLEDKRNPSLWAVAIRAIAWLAVSNVVFTGMIDWFLDISEEFGVELPVATTLVIAMAKFQRKFWFFAIPVSVFVYLGAEALIWNSVERYRWWTVGLFWFVMLLFFLTIAMAFGCPLIQMFSDWQ